MQDWDDESRNHIWRTEYFLKIMVWRRPGRLWFMQTFHFLSFRLLISHFNKKLSFWTVSKWEKQCKVPSCIESRKLLCIVFWPNIDNHLIKMSIIGWFGSANSFNFESFSWRTPVINVTHYFKLKFSLKTSASQFASFHFHWRWPRLCWQYPFSILSRSDLFFSFTVNLPNRNSRTTVSWHGRRVQDAAR